MPSTHNEQAELKDAWHGVTMGKNILRLLRKHQCRAVLHAWLSKEAKALAALAGITIGVFTLIMTRSATSVMCTLFAVMFMLILLRSPGSLEALHALPGWALRDIDAYLRACGAAAGSGMEIFLKPIVTLTGKDFDLYGPHRHLDILNEHIRLRPFSGSGYGAYWAGATPTSPSFEMLTRLYFYPTEGHNVIST